MVRLMNGNIVVGKSAGLEGVSYLGIGSGTAWTGFCTFAEGIRVAAWTGRVSDLQVSPRGERCLGGGGLDGTSRETTSTNTPSIETG